MPRLTTPAVFRKSQGGLHSLFTIVGFVISLSKKVYIRGKQTRDKRDIRVFGPEMSLMGLVMFAYEHFVSVAEIILENCDSFITIYSN